MAAVGAATPELTSKVMMFGADTGPPLNENASVNGVEPLMLNTVSCWVLVAELPLGRL
jgi:hypothetical protein